MGADFEVDFDADFEIDLHGDSRLIRSSGFGFDLDDDSGWIWTLISRLIRSRRFGLG